jgi:hypothetical protein
MVALSNASPLESFERSTIVSRLIADSRCVVLLSSQLKLGKALQLMEWRTGRMTWDKVAQEEIKPGDRARGRPPIALKAALRRH